MSADRALVATWLDTVARHSAIYAQRPGLEALPVNATVFSSFVYEDSCTGARTVAYIEPLAGDFRHPLAIPACKRYFPSVDAEDRRYMLVSASSASSACSASGR
jgi:hypothetical protein